MLAEISAGLSSLKAAFDITKGLNAASTQATVNEATIPLQQHIIEAQQALSAANDIQTASSERLRELEHEIVRLKDWSAEKERYELKRFYPGSIAYALKPAMSRGEPPHLLCPNCYELGQKSFLQATGEQVRRYRVHRCPSCKTDLALGQEMPNEMPATEAQEVVPPQAPYDRLAELRDDQG